MKNSIAISVLILISFVFIANRNSSFKIDCYPKYWDKYTKSELNDRLYADTSDLFAGRYIDSSNRAFYRNAISELIKDIEDDKNQLDSLFPQIEIEYVLIKNLKNNTSDT